MRQRQQQRRRQRLHIPVRSNGRADGNSTRLGDLGGDVRDAANVQFAVLLAEAQLGTQVLANLVAVQQRHGLAAVLEQRDAERIGDGRLSGAAEASEEEREALVRRRRVGLAQDLDDGREREPLGNIEALVETATQLSAREILGRAAGRDVVDRAVLGEVLDPHHLLVHEHIDTNLFCLFVCLL